MKDLYKIRAAISLRFTWIFLAAYITVALTAWYNRKIILDLIPINIKSFSHYSIIEKCIYFCFATVVLLVMFQSLIAVGSFRIMSYQKKFSRIGLKNKNGETPVFIKKYSDKKIPHLKKWLFDGVGLTLDDFESVTKELNKAFKCKITTIADGKSNRIIVNAYPKKYALPRVISTNCKKLVDDMINLLCVGKTGSGKSYALTVILGLFAQIPNVSITICDYKKSSFAEFEDTPNFYGYEDVPNGIREFYKEFTERLQANDEQRNKQIRVLMIDEYGALISAQDKKAADELKTMVANMLFMGRSLGIRVLIGVQRADAEHFKSGARDQFRAILALGEISKEQKQMLFTDYKDKMTDKNGLGEGYLLIDGQDIERVKIAYINDFDSLNESIRQAMQK